MATVTIARALMAAIKDIAIHLTNEEVFQITTILDNAADRIEKEQGELNE